MILTKDICKMKSYSSESSALTTIHVIQRQVHYLEVTEEMSSQLVYLLVLILINVLLVYHTRDTRLAKANQCEHKSTKTEAVFTYISTVLSRIHL